MPHNRPPQKQTAVDKAAVYFMGDEQTLPSPDRRGDRPTPSNRRRTVRIAGWPALALPPVPDELAEQGQFYFESTKPAVPSRERMLAVMSRP
jgi:hypothetical protein